jgi:hypothetical protein
VQLVGEISLLLCGKGGELGKREGADPSTTRSVDSGQVDSGTGHDHRQGGEGGPRGGQGKLDLL